MDYEKNLGEVIGRPYFRLAFIIVCLLLLGFVAFKEGFSLWILSKLSFTKEHLTADERAAINSFYPGPTGTLAAARQKLASVTGAYSAV